MISAGGAPENDVAAGALPAYRDAEVIIDAEHCVFGDLRYDTGAVRRAWIETRFPWRGLAVAALLIVAGKFALTPKQLVPIYGWLGFLAWIVAMTVVVNWARSAPEWLVLGVDDKNLKVLKSGDGKRLKAIRDAVNKVAGHGSGTAGTATPPRAAGGWRPPSRLEVPPGKTEGARPATGARTAPGDDRTQGASAGPPGSSGQSR